MASLGLFFKLSLNLSKVHKFKTDIIWLLCALYLLLSGAGSALVTVGLSLQLGLSLALPSPTQLVAIRRLFCTHSEWLGHGTVSSWPWPKPPTQATEPECTWWTASDHTGHHQTTSMTNTLKEQTRHQRPAKVSLALWGWPSFCGCSWFFLPIDL